MTWGQCETARVGVSVFDIGYATIIWHTNTITIYIYILHITYYILHIHIHIHIYMCDHLYTRIYTSINFRNHPSTSAAEQRFLTFSLFFFFLSSWSRHFIRSGILWVCFSDTTRSIFQSRNEAWLLPLQWTNIATKKKNVSIHWWFTVPIRHGDVHEKLLVCHKVYELNPWIKPLKNRFSEMTSPWVRNGRHLEPGWFPGCKSCFGGPT